MRHALLFAIPLIVLAGCGHTPPDLEAPREPAAVSGAGVLVSNAEELSEAISNATPGTEIVMANGEWTDLQIRFVGHGTADRPIRLRAETPGEVLIQGQSNLMLGGEHLVVDGLHFVNGATPSDAVIQFFVSRDTLANHSRVTNCVIDGFNQAQRDRQDLWVLFRGRHNQLDHCYLAGKSNRGPTVRVDLSGNESVYNYHRITDNHFGPRPPKGGPSAETIQIGDSGTSMTPSHTLVQNNLFDRCDGEVEIISSKSNFNEFRGNVFYKSEGSLVTRHGNYAVVDGNYFIGDGMSPAYGGIRLIGTGHWVTNNYFYNLRGSEFRSPLAMMNGIERPAVNRYFQVTDVVVAHNTWVDSPSPWQFGVGSNTDQADVLPASEIRSETPIRTLLANNVIYHSEGDPMPIVRHDSIGGITFVSNVIDNQGVPFEGVEGLATKDFSMAEIEENLWVPSSGLGDVAVYSGFEFDQIKEDLFRNPRSPSNSVGATNGASAVGPDLMNRARYGPEGYDPEAPGGEAPQTRVAADADELAQAVARASEGDTVVLSADRYELASPLAIRTRLTIRSSDPEHRAVLLYSGEAETPAFEMNPGGHLFLESVVLQGSGENHAFASRRDNMSSLYTLEVSDSEISNFDTVLKAYKFSFSESITFRSSVIRNVQKGLDLASEDDARGDYNAENVYVFDSQFDQVAGRVIDYYRGGYDESTVGGNLVVRGSTFTLSGAGGEGTVLIGTHGIINVDLSNNTFRDNDVDLVARLWGAKNNSESGNVVENSGEIIVEQNLAQELVY